MASELIPCTIEHAAANQWRQVRVEHVCETVSVGIVIQPTQYYVSADYGIRAFRSANVGENKVIDRDWVYLSPEGHKKNSKSALQAGDVLVVRSGALAGTACVVPKDFAGSNCIDVVFARPKPQFLIPEYLAEVTNSPVGCRHVTDTKGGLAIGHFNVSAFKKLSMLLPGVREQERIVSLLSTWDRSIEGTDALIAAKEQRHRWLLQRLISDKAARHHWETQELSNVIRERSERSTGHDEHPVLTSSRRGLFLQSEYFSKQVTSEDNTGYKIMRHGDFTFRSMSDDGRFVFNRLEKYDSGIISPAYGVFYADGVSPGFLAHYLNSAYFAQMLARETQGGTRKALRFSALAGMEVDLPNRADQERIAAILDESRREIDLLQTQLQMFRQQKRGLMQKLLTGEWRVPVAEAEVA